MLDDEDMEQSRFLLGVEVMGLMGIPINRMVGLNATQDTVFRLIQIHDGFYKMMVSCFLKRGVTSSLLKNTEVLHSIGGNAMSLRAALAGICAALACIDPRKFVVK